MKSNVYIYNYHSIGTCVVLMKYKLHDCTKYKTWVNRESNNVVVDQKLHTTIHNVSLGW